MCLSLLSIRWELKLDGRTQKFTWSTNTWPEYVRACPVICVLRVCVKPGIEPRASLLHSMFHHRATFSRQNAPEWLSSFPPRGRSCLPRLQLASPLDRGPEILSGYWRVQIKIPDSRINLDYIPNLCSAPTWLQERGSKDFLVLGAGFLSSPFFSPLPLLPAKQTPIL